MSFKERTLEIFSKPHLLGFKNVKETDRHIMYAFIESMNEQSKHLVHQAGYEYIRSSMWHSVVQPETRQPRCEA